MTARTNNSLRRQQGAALLMIMLVILVTATAIFVSKLSTAELRRAQLDETQAALAAARQALVDYALVQPDLSFGQPPTLPCPDFDDSLGLTEGSSHTPACGAAGVSVLGRFPWRTLGIETPKDGSSACLWYAVSGSWKEAAAATSAMINPDSNGQLQLWGVEASIVIDGALPEDRPVAMLIAPMRAVQGQTRSATVGRQCSPDFNAADFLDVDANSGISNAALSGSADIVDQLAVGAGYNELHNDRVLTVTRRELEAAITSRPDFEVNMRRLGLAVTACIADYARHNVGGPNDRRLPWPAPLSMADYRIVAQYDDTAGPSFAGRVMDIVGDSNSQTGNTILEAMSGCDSAVVVDWSPGMQALWSHWKDHFLYVVAESFAPTAAVPSICSNCLSVNGSGQYAAVVLFANSRLDALAQRRNAPPTDADTKDDVSNLLEGANALAFPYTGGPLNLLSQPASQTFNDILFCIDDVLDVTEC